LPHGIWPSGDGTRIYVALENGNHAVAIDTLTNKVIANIPVGQTTQALVYVPGAVPSGDGTDNLVPLGEAANTEHVRLEAAGTVLPAAQASVAVNSLGLLDLLEIASKGLASLHRPMIPLTGISSHWQFSRQIPMAQESCRRSGRSKRSFTPAQQPKHRLHRDS
jgi:YVTN family beta-propeller protein